MGTVVIVMFARIQVEGDFTIAIAGLGVLAGPECAFGPANESHRMNSMPDRPQKLGWSEVPRRRAPIKSRGLFSLREVSHDRADSPLEGIALSLN